MVDGSVVDGGAVVDGGRTPDAGVRPRRPGLSPSRANDFMQCPLLFRFRVVDQLPEPPSERRRARHARARGARAALRRPGRRAHRGGGAGHAARRVGAPARGGAAVRRAVHLVGRGRDLARRRRRPRRHVLHARGPHAAGAARARALRREPARRRTAAPRHRRPARRRTRTARCGSSTTRRGGPRAPATRATALFQMRFYALVLWRTTGQVPRMLQLVYLGDGQVLRHEPRRGGARRHRAPGPVACGRPSSGPHARATGSRARRRCAAGARTRRCARRSAATPPQVPAGAVELALGVVPDAERVPSGTAA